MKVAISKWQGRISPVFDEAEKIVIFNVNEEGSSKREEIIFNSSVPFERERILHLKKIDVLICGAISRTLELQIISAGIQVIPNTCGLAGEVLTAFLNGKLHQKAFLMPGCCNRRRRFRQRGNFNKS